MHGARISVTIGLTATTLSTGLGILIGVPSGFLGGRLDIAVQRFVDAFMAIPGITIMSLVEPGMLQDHPDRRDLFRRAPPLGRFRRLARCRDWPSGPALRMPVTTAPVARMVTS